jgi:hypothetical protein
MSKKMLPLASMANKHIPRAFAVVGVVEFGGVSDGHASAGSGAMDMDQLRE